MVITMVGILDTMKRQIFGQQGITTIELVTGSPPLSQYDPLKILFDIPKKATTVVRD